MYRVKKDKTLLSDVNTERDVRFVLSQAREKAIKIHHATESDARIQRWPFLSPPQSFARAFTIEIIPSSSVDYFRLCLRTIASTLPLLSREIRFERILFRDIMKSLSLSPSLAFHFSPLCNTTPPLVSLLSTPTLFCPPFECLLDDTRKH